MTERTVSPEEVWHEIRVATVSEVLSAVEREGDGGPLVLRAVDDWSPPTFRVPAETVAAAESRPSDELREHVAFTQA